MSTTLETHIGIFWDYENCRPPSNISGGKLVENICRLVRCSGAISQFKAYLDVSSEVVQPRSIAFHSDLQSSGVTLAYCPHNGKKDVADKMMIVDMLAFALDKPPPAKIVIITGDRDFAYASAILRLRGYETVIISPPNTGHASLKMQADQLLDWQKDVIDATSPDASAVGEAASQSTTGITAEDSKPKVSGSPRTCSPTEKSETGTCLSKPVLDDIVKSSTGATMDNTDTDSGPSPKETAPSFLKSLSTFFSGEPKSSQEPIFKADTPSRPDQPVVSSSKVSNEPGCMLSGSEKAHVAGLSVDAVSNCGCAICRRSDNVKEESSGIGVPTAKQPVVSCPGQRYNFGNWLEDTIDSSTNTPTSVSTVTSSSNTTRSTTSSIANKDPSTTPSPASVLRFQLLINYFIEQRALTGLTRIRYSDVAFELQKSDSMGFTKSGAVKMKQYIKEAREAGVITSPDLYYDWIEINPSLYPKAKLTPSHKGSETTPFTRTFRPATGLESFKPFEPVVDVAFKPLVTRLQMESPDYRLLYSVLGQYFKTQYPFLYDDAGVYTLSQYLRKAADKSIVRLGNISSPGRQWAELTEGLR